jgi:hypothetical protein
VRERAVATCGHIFDALPDDLPPKRIIRGIEKIQDQNAEIVRLLEQEGGRGAASRDPVPTSL